MANLIIAVAALGVLITGVSAVAFSWLTPASAAIDHYREAMLREGQAARAALTLAAQCETALDTTISFSVENTAQSRLRNFVDWELIAYYKSDGDYLVDRLAHTEAATPSAGQWTISSIEAADGGAETVEPDIVNYGERANFLVELSSSVWADPVNKMVLATDLGNTMDVPLDGVSSCAYYLHNNPTPPSGTTTAQTALPLDGTFPGQPTLYNYDTDRDSIAGLLIVRGGSGPAEADLTKYQNWRTNALGEELVLTGTVVLDFWAAMSDFSATSTGEVNAYLRDYDGASYAEVASATVTGSPWDAEATGDFVSKSASFTGLSYTVAEGNRLEVKVVVGSGSDADMVVAYDATAYASKLTFTKQFRLTLESEPAKISTTEYYTLVEDTLGSGTTKYYLHSNPTPPTGATSSQVDLPLDQTAPATSTLYNYDADRDADAGLLVIKSGAGPAEADLTKYQNWRTDALAAELAISGDVLVHLWSALKDFDTGGAGSVTAYLRDYDGASYSEIASATLTSDPWDSSDGGTWIERTVRIPSVNYLVPAGNRLELKVIVGNDSDDSIWFAYDTAAYSSYIELVGDLPSAATLTAEAGSQTGRFRPNPNEGRFVYPLKGYSKLSDSTWTVTYRVRGESQYGFTWRTTAQDVTPGTIDEWVDIDLSSYVAADATGAIVELVNNHPSSALSAVVRGKEDTREYMPTGSSQQMGGRVHRWQIVKMDSSKLIQGYVEDTSNASLKLIGFTFGTDPGYFEQPPDVTPGTAGAWTTVDLSAHVDADADGVILMIDSVGNDTGYAIREIGSSDNDTANVINGQGNTLYVVGIDDSSQFDAYLATADVNIYLIAQTKGSLVFYSDDVAVSDPSPNSWQEIDADTYSVPSAANGLILRAENEQNKRNDIGFRHGDSTDDWNKQLWNNGHFQAPAGLNDANVWDEYMGSTNVNVAIAAYTLSVIPDYDVHAEIDVLVREDVTGAVRAVLATDVATTTDTLGGDWATYTGTFTPVEYTVVAPTDYLEIGLFAHFTRNGGISAKLDFSVSDVSLPAVDNVALRPD